MTQYGQTHDGQQLFGLISLLTLLAFWIVVWRRDRQATRWFREWAERRRTQSEADRRGGGPSHGGPWG